MSTPTSEAEKAYPDFYTTPNGRIYAYAVEERRAAFLAGWAAHAERVRGLTERAKFFEYWANELAGLCFMKIATAGQHAAEFLKAKAAFEKENGK